MHPKLFQKGMGYNFVHSNWELEDKHIRLNCYLDIVLQGILLRMQFHYILYQVHN